MLVKDFSFELPEALIARYPAKRREESRLMLLDRRSGSISDSSFSKIPGCFRDGDLLVLNDTRVIPARLSGRKVTGGKVELFLTEPAADGCWHCLLRSSKPFSPGQQILFDDGASAILVEQTPFQGWLVRFEAVADFYSWLEKMGKIPIPPYLNREAEELDRHRYQTVYAAKNGAVAAPTAGLHFTEPLLDAIRQRGVRVASITLHVGPGTFQPVRVDKVQDHRIHSERYHVTQETAALVNDVKKNGGRVIAVGTTTCRTLEYAADGSGLLQSGSGKADIFIYPGYRFRVVDALLTNFHLPESTLLMLVAAFAGQQQILDAYRHAVRHEYRFYSYGDAMLIQ